MEPAQKRAGGGHLGGQLQGLGCEHSVRLIGPFMRVESRCSKTQAFNRKRPLTTQNHLVPQLLNQVLETRSLRPAPSSTAQLSQALLWSIAIEGCGGDICLGQSQIQAGTAGCPDLRVGTAPIWHVGGAEGLGLEGKSRLAPEIHSPIAQLCTAAPTTLPPIPTGCACRDCQPSSCCCASQSSWGERMHVHGKGRGTEQGSGGGRGHTVVRSDRVLWGGQWEGELLQRQGRRHQRTPPHHAPRPDCHPSTATRTGTHRQGAKSTACPYKLPQRKQTLR